MKRLAVLLCLAAGGQACSDPVVPDPEDASTGGQDASIADSGDGGATTATIEIGTGQDTFEPLAGGETLPLVAGPQGGGRNGGYHLWFAVRVKNYDPREIELNFDAIDPTNNMSFGSQGRTLDLLPIEDAFGAWGIAVRMDDCCVVTGKEVIMRVTARDRDGLMGMDERRITAAASCPEPGSGQNICP